MIKDIYWEVRTGAGVAIVQFTSIPTMKRWLARRKNFEYLPSYHIFKITKTEETADEFIPQDEPTTTAREVVQQESGYYSDKV